MIKWNRCYAGEGVFTYSGSQHDDAEDKADPRTNDATNGRERDLIKSMAVVLPGSSEANMRQADGAPCEKSGKRRKRKKPVEHFVTAVVHAHKGEKSADEVKNDRGEGAARTINVGEDLGCVTLLSQGSKGAGSSVHRGNTNGEHRDEDDKVHEVVKRLKGGILGSQHERRRIRARVSLLGQKVLIIGADEETNEEQAEDIEQSDTPEDLLDSAGQSLDGVAGLGGSKTNQFRSGKREGSGNEDGAEADETVLERTRLVPVPGTPVLAKATILRSTSANKDEGDNHEDDGSGKLKRGRDEFLFGVPDSTKDVEDCDGNQKYNDPNGFADRVVPVFDSDGADG